ncbi:related to cell surface ferroxidase [Cephalotrichum gorgonifer]|uniref:Related to cell surface ferroxidase n=1 Tax=Cephalotrichum gorgonifer TaxID=2041049 RepID=A0AAE8MTU7_9PEZI|nr:related to cell surface ferroxidase [Cephalotrichum gorgonifer]
MVWTQSALSGELWYTTASDPPSEAAPDGLAAVVKKEWNIGWVQAAPDGFARSVIGINGQWPCPTLEVDIGDKVIIEVTNGLGNETTSLHWHGLFQEGSNLFDGPAHVTQCPIPPGASFTYEFEVHQPGTYWYHAHIGAQYSDGLRAPLIVHDRNSPYEREIEAEYVLSVSDWYHDQTPTLLEQLFDVSNVGVRLPPIKSCLINDATQNKYEILPGKKYKFRIVNMSAHAGAAIFITDHRFTVVEVDGVYTKPTSAAQLYLAPGQRYSVIVEGKESKEKNYAVNVVLDVNPDVLTYFEPVGFKWNGTAYLEYDAGNPTPEPEHLNEFHILDDLSLEPFDGEEILGEPDKQIQMDVGMGLDTGGIPRAFVNNVSYVHQDTPTLFTALTVGKDAENPEVYGQVNPYVTKRGEIIEITVNNLAASHHPFHLHGHHFQVLSRRPVGSGPFDASAESDFPEVPLRRDTIVVHGRSSVVIRFKADNPGVWLFHCHFEWHVALGMTATFIEDPLELQKITGPVPQAHRALCDAQCLHSSGNAAGNTEDHFNLEGAAPASHVPAHGAVYQEGTCNAEGGEDSGAGNEGDDSAAGNEYPSSEGGDSEGKEDADPAAGEGEGDEDADPVAGEGEGDYDDGSDAEGEDPKVKKSGCPEGHTCSGPYFEKGEDGEWNDGKFTRYVTEAYHVTSTSTHTNIVCATAAP